MLKTNSNKNINKCKLKLLKATTIKNPKLKRNKTNCTQNLSSSS